MSKVVDIRSKSPHMTGRCVCLQCKNKWVGVAEIGTTCLQCPSCGLDKGVFSAVAMPESYWECECGCAHFAIGLSSTICLYCGLAQNFGDD